MEKNKKQRIILDLPGETTMVEVIEDILKNNGLEESDDDYFYKSIKGEESRFIVMRDACFVIAKRKIPEDKLLEILAEHLETSKETAEKILSDIKQKLIPFAKWVPIITEEEKRKSEIKAESTQDIILEKIRKSAVAEKSSPSTPKQLGVNPVKSASPVGEAVPRETGQFNQVKKVEIKDVDKNAEKMKVEREALTQKNTIGSEVQNKGKTNDPYREPVE